MQNRDLSWLTLLVLGSLSMLGVCFFVLYLVRLVQKRNRELWEVRRKLELQMMKSNIEIQDRALEVISMEVHDNVAQVLGMTNMLFINAVKGGGDGYLRRLVEESIVRIGSAIQDLRDVTHSLNTKKVVEIGLEAAIEKEVSFANRLHPVMHFSFGTRNMESCGDLTEEQTLFLFRIVQECMQNAIKHSGARNVSVLLEFNQGQVSVAIQDDGTGFHLEARKSGIGFHNMKERMAILKGSLEVDSVPGVGTTVVSILKIANEHD